jgi:chloramphenicol-sensitive protein RarD
MSGDRSPSAAAAVRSQPSGSHATAKSSARWGAVAAALCYFVWGIVPLYWKQLAAIDSLELIAHRHVWSLLFVLAVVGWRGAWPDVRRALDGGPAIMVNFAGAVLLTGNWLIYVWGVNTGHVIECSLGYFLVPLVNVASGRFVLHEHLRPAQWLAIALATAGVGWLIARLGRPPWIALGLAATWGGYSLMRKKSPLGPLVGLTAETMLLSPAAIGFLVWQFYTGRGALGRVDLTTHALVLSSGVITAIPLLLFAFGARRIRLSTLGLLQYIAPTVQFAIGRWFYHEAFSRDRALSFIAIWAGLALYTADNLLAQRRPAADPAGVT